ncbi:hypothetical protein [Sphingomonas hankyongi]|uniref:Transcriptional regulator n=1 Tax=Sphingomonas hankyongi TaxID=2908209 RepID=A0ABT0S1S3_9SPHN|nr:hypothetical protein [Sphingomonas hankyongi]MCL6729804.1 hypothetical protein [Sphingomonas hankyongi]
MASERKVVRAPSYMDKMTPSERQLHRYELIGWIVTGIIKEGNCERNERIDELIGELDIALQEALGLYRVTN